MGIIGAGLGALTKGILSLFPGPAPEYQNAKFGGQADLDDLQRRSARSPEELRRMSLEGTGDASVMQGSPEQMQSERTALGSAGGDDISEALSRRSSKRFGGDLAKLKRQADVESVDRKSKATQTSFNMNQAKIKLDQYQKDLAAQAQAEKEAARYSVLAGLFQTGADFAGTGLAKMTTKPDGKG